MLKNNIVNRCSKGMEPLLFLVHRIPYPPNKGDKIRSFHFLKHLSEHFDVYLGAFIDDEDDLAYISTVKQYCTDVNLISINPIWRTAISAKGLLTGSSLSVPYYDIDSMHHWVDSAIQQHQIKKAFVFSSVMAQFVTRYKNMDIIADFVDIDSDKWRQYAEKKSWPISWVYSRESKCLLDYEMKVTKQSSQVLFVSEKEAELFKTFSHELSPKIDFVNNGVDIDFFTPSKSFSNPYKEHETAIVFTGAMDYWANVDAVVWFVEKVMPELRTKKKGMVFYIVGSKPSSQVRDLHAHDDVVVTGRVDDMRPYIQYADVIVAPLRIARGIQNKVLEAMAMGKPIVASPQAMEGIDADVSGVKVADEPNEFVGAVLDMLLSESYLFGNREFVEANFSWLESGNKLVSIINNIALPEEKS